MLHASPPAWAQFLPGYGGFRLLTNAILTHSPARAGPLLIALGWLAGATVAATLLSATTCARPARGRLSQYRLAG